MLAAALARTDGPVLELGCGWNSTPMLSLMCHDDRKYVVAEYIPPMTTEEAEDYYRTGKKPYNWLDNFDALRPGRITQIFCEVHDWDAWTGIEAEYWDVAFVDCSPGEKRVDLCRRLADRCLYIVCHDTNADIPPSGGNYGWAKLFPEFKYVSTYKFFRPWTTVLSNVEEFRL